MLISIIYNIQYFLFLIQFLIYFQISNFNQFTFYFYIVENIKNFRVRKKSIRIKTSKYFENQSFGLRGSNYLFYKDIVE